MSRPRVWALAVVAGAALLVAIRGFVVEPRRVERVVLDRETPGLASGPVRALLFSDVGFKTMGRRERAVVAAGRDFDPDVVLVAGDLLNRIEETSDEERLAGAQAFLGGIPHRAGVFLVPGEDESHAIERLRDRWSGVADVLSNDRRWLSVRGETIDLFGAHPRVDPAPWPIGRDGTRGVVGTGHRPNDPRHRLLCVAPGSAQWGSLEVTFAFQALDPYARIEIRLGWNEDRGAVEGRGLRLARPEWRRDFKLYASPPGADTLIGRADSGFVPPAGRWCRARVQLEDRPEGRRARARFWIDAEPEPGEWSIDARERNPSAHRGGTIALGGGPGRRRYADVRIADDRGRLLLQEDFQEVALARRCWSSGSALERWIEDPRPGTARLLLAHDPDIVLEVAALGGRDALVLAGHTHGGQLRIPGYGAPFVSTQLGPRYDRGWFERDGVPFYITAGIGTSSVPFRLFDPPEVTLLTLRPPARTAVSARFLPVSGRSRRL